MNTTPETIDKILEISKPEYNTFGDIEYSTKQLYRIKPPTPDSLLIHTLTGLADYINKKIDGIKDPFFHVKDHETVCIFSHLNDHQSRKFYMVAEMDLPGFNFNKYFGLEDFIINIQSQFVDGEKTSPKADLLTFLSTINSSVIEKYVDTGVSQTVQIKAGLKGDDSTASVSVPSGPLKLKPYRTFREINQPISNFVFRMRKSSAGQPEAALFEADGQEWKLEAIQNIKKWLEEHTKDIPVIA